MMNRIRVKITMSTGEVWYASSMQVKSTPERTVNYLNILSRDKRLGSTYELATEEEYTNFRERRRAEFCDFTFATPPPMNGG